MNPSRLLNGTGPVLALVVAAAVVGAVHGDFPDLSVYRYGGRAALDGLPLYAADDPVTGYPFTYPPFAAVAMVPLALLPVWASAALWTGASVAALAVVVAVTRRALGRPAPGWLVALVTGAAVALEPVWQNLTFGQVNTLLMCAVLVDLLGPDRRWSGVLVGIAAGLKLTPLVFVVLLVLVGRRSAAGRALVAFAGTVAVGFAAMPGAASSYWTHGLVDATRVGPPELAHNQSAYGALTRLLDGPPPTLVWLAVAAPLAGAVLLLAAQRWRTGDRVLGTCLGAVAMLVASPISWSHHWVWVVPVGLVLWERNRWAAAAWVAVFVARPIVWPPYGRDREYAWGPTDHLVGNAYLLAALVLTLWAAGSAGYARTRSTLARERRSQLLGAMRRARPAGTR
jgi:alpha-1,2-mannosyltransferase